MALTFDKQKWGGVRSTLLPRENMFQAQQAKGKTWEAKMQGKYECTYGAIYMYVYLWIQLYRCLEMNTYVCLHTMSTYICVNLSVLPHNLSKSQARADKTWQSSWIARRSSYQRSKQSNMRSGSQTRSKWKLWKWCPRCPRKAKNVEFLTFGRPHW